MYITNSLVVALFFVIWLISACCTFSIGYFVMQKVQANEDTTPFMIGHLIITIVPSSLTIIILHFVKIVKLRKSQALRKNMQRINTVVSIILGIYIVYNFQKVMLIQNVAILQFFHKSITISAFIQHASNPIIYVVFTPLVQRPWQRLMERLGRREIPRDIQSEL
jgi:hypothetical protein